MVSANLCLSSPLGATGYTMYVVYVAVNFLFQLIFVFPLFLGMVMYANEFETKEKQKLTEIKNKLQHIHSRSTVSICLLQR